MNSGVPFGLRIGEFDKANHRRTASTANRAYVAVGANASTLRANDRVWRKREP